MTKPTHDLETGLQKFHSWLLQHRAEYLRGGDENSAATVDLIEGTFSKMLDAVDPPLLPTEANDTQGLHWMKDHVALPGCGYYLEDPRNNNVIAVIVALSVMNCLKFFAKCLDRFELMIPIGKFDSLDEAKRAVENKLEQRLPPLPDPPAYPLWVRNGNCTQLFNISGTCVGSITEKHPFDDERLFFHTIITPIDGTWATLGYLGDLSVAMHLVESQLERAQQNLKTST